MGWAVLAAIFTFLAILSFCFPKTVYPITTACLSNTGCYLLQFHLVFTIFLLIVSSLIFPLSFFFLLFFSFLLGVAFLFCFLSFSVTPTVLVSVTTFYVWLACTRKKTQDTSSWLIYCGNDMVCHKTHYIIKHCTNNTSSHSSKFQSTRTDNCLPYTLRPVYVWMGLVLSTT